MSSLLYKRSIEIGGGISLYVPTVGEVFDNENDYYNTVALITSTPYDMMVQLDDIGLDFTTINEYDLFCLLFSILRKKDTTLLFGDIDISHAVIAKSEDTGEDIIVDTESGLIIDRSIHAKMAQSLRKLLSLPKNDKRPGNEEAKKYLISRERKKLKRRLRNPQPDSQMESHIVALVNTEQFPYTFETVRDITIYQFNASLQQVAHKINYDNTMRGYFAGTIKFDKIPPDDRTWIRTNKER